MKSIEFFWLNKVFATPYKTDPVNDTFRCNLLPGLIRKGHYGAKITTEKLAFEKPNKQISLNISKDTKGNINRLHGSIQTSGVEVQYVHSLKRDWKGNVHIELCEPFEFEKPIPENYKIFEMIIPYNFLELEPKDLPKYRKYCNIPFATLFIAICGVFLTVWSLYRSSQNHTTNYIDSSIHANYYILYGN